MFRAFSESLFNGILEESGKEFEVLQRKELALNRVKEFYRKGEYEKAISASYLIDDDCVERGECDRISLACALELQDSVLTAELTKKRLNANPYDVDAIYGIWRLKGDNAVQLAEKAIEHYCKIGDVAPLIILAKYALIMSNVCIAEKAVGCACKIKPYALNVLYHKTLLNYIRGAYDDGDSDLKQARALYSSDRKLALLNYYRGIGGLGYGELFAGYSLSAANTVLADYVNRALGNKNISDLSSAAEAVCAVFENGATAFTALKKLLKRDYVLGFKVVEKIASSPYTDYETRVEALRVLLKDNRTSAPIAVLEEDKICTVKIAPLRCKDAERAAQRVFLGAYTESFCDELYQNNNPYTKLMVAICEDMSALYTESKSAVKVIAAAITYYALNYADEKITIQELAEEKGIPFATLSEYCKYYKPTAFVR